MKLSEKQKESIKTAFGSDTQGAEEALDLIDKRKGALQIFDAEGNFNSTIEELWKKLKRSSVKKKTKKEENVNDQAVYAAKNLKELIEKLPDTTKVQDLKNLLTEIGSSLDETEKRVKKTEIVNIKNQIQTLQDRLGKLEEEVK